MIFNPLEVSKTPGFAFREPSRVLAHTGFTVHRFFLKLIKLLMLLTLNKNHTILQMSGRGWFSFVFAFAYEGLRDSVARNKRTNVHTLLGNFRTEAELAPFPIEAAGILLNETPRRTAGSLRTRLLSVVGVCCCSGEWFCGGLFVFGCDW